MPRIGIGVGIGRALRNVIAFVLRPAPIMPASATLSVDEGTPNTTVIGTILATNHGASSPSYAFAGPVPGIIIHPLTGVVSVADSGALQVGAIQVAVSGTNLAGGGFTAATINVNVVLQAPIMPVSASFAFTEGVPDGTVLGQVLALNHSEIQPVEYSFQETVAGLAISTANGAITVADTTLLIVGETGVTVIATNAAGSASALTTFLVSARPTNSNVFYVSLDGDDLNNGTSEATPWRTIAKVNGHTFAPGSLIQFRGGDVFLDQLNLQAGQHYGTALGGPIRYTSYGSGRATHRPPTITESGLSATNPQHVEITDLNFIGTGRDINTASGISMQTTTGGSVRRTGVVIQRCEVSGFGNDGILFWSNAADNSPSGIDDVLIEDVDVHDCCGIGSDTGGNGILFVSNAYGLAINQPSFHRPTIRRCRVYDNPGKAGMAKHSGSGILLGECSGALIEFCEAYRNGAANTFATGPVGIWMYDCVDSIIQFCISRDNATGAGTSDGGGFDIDGGCQRCIVQYCYSSSNFGSGQQLYQFDGGAGLLPLTGNHIRFNISENDGAQDTANKGGLLIGSAVAVNQPNNYVYNNTFRSSRANARGVFIFNNPDRFTGTIIANNIFDLSGTGSQAIRSDASAGPAITCLANLYDTPTISIKWGATTYTTIADWRAAFPTQETVSGANVSVTGDPLFEGPLPVGTITGFDPSRLNAYRTQIASPSRETGVNLEALYSIDTGPRDFFNNPLAPAGIDIGAHTPDDAISVDFTGTLAGTLTALDATQMGFITTIYGTRDILFGYAINPTNITTAIDEIVGEIAL